MMKRFLLIATIALLTTMTMTASDQQRRRGKVIPNRQLDLTAKSLVMPEALKPGDKIAII